MRRNKPRKNQRKNNLKDCESRLNVYLQRSESASDSQCTFDEIQEHDLNDLQPWENDEAREATEDFCEAKQYTNSHNKLLPDVKRLPVTPLSSEVKTFDLCSVYSLQGASEKKGSVFQGNFDDAEHEVTESDLVAFSSDMGRTSTGCKFPHSKRSETIEGSDRLQSRNLLDYKQQTRHSKVDFVPTRTNNADNNRTTGSLPFLQKPRQEKMNLSRNKQKCKKQESQTNDSDVGILSGKKLANSIAPEFHNLRHFLPLLTLCQCSDYDSAVIEVVQDYNDPCRGAASQMRSPYH